MADQADRTRILAGLLDRLDDQLDRARRNELSAYEYKKASGNNDDKIRWMATNERVDRLMADRDTVLRMWAESIAAERAS